MAANNASREIREWLRSQGEDVQARGAIPGRLTEKYYQAHPDRRPDGARPRLLPAPDADDDELDAWEDMGVIGPESPVDVPGDDRIPDGPSEPAGADAPPAHGRKEWRKETREPKTGGPVRVTAGVRKDINAKISFALEVPARVWQARDPVCGSTFVEQRPVISDALTEIVCQSSDLVAWFAGTGGQFMLWLNLAAACWPVVTVAMAHHVYHSIGQGQDGDPMQPDYGQYAA